MGIILLYGPLLSDEILSARLNVTGNVKGAYGHPSPRSPSSGVIPRDEPLEMFLAFKVCLIFHVDQRNTTLISRKLLLFFQILAVLALGLIRLSILFFYRRLFLVHSRSRFDSMSKILLWIVAAWTVIFFFLVIFYCGLDFPIQNMIGGGYGPQCLNITGLLVGFAVTDIVLDLVIWILPMPMVSLPFPVLHMLIVFPRSGNFELPELEKLL